MDEALIRKDLEKEDEEVISKLEQEIRLLHKANKKLEGKLEEAAQCNQTLQRQLEEKTLHQDQLEITMLSLSRVS
jgi:hypothetical protein